ncbi:hypothetical protein VIGAN_01031000 [Vigna angularis var. angularis]|uniref:Uncharacterized protein n=1 Tax=Vigna angularis var. angularis TaxID=157739 RepID=A0A0S3QX71_PHAAN|nr:hypothetical protein VIGAN_01031000 [Vigna angularis var. angularis]
MHMNSPNHKPPKSMQIEPLNHLYRGSHIHHEQSPEAFDSALKPRHTTCPTLPATQYIFKNKPKLWNKFQTRENKFQNSESIPNKRTQI